MIQHVAVVSESDGLEFGELAETVAAIQKQVLRDFGPLWDVQATVDAFARLEDVPEGYWRAIVADELDERTLGFHRDRAHQPYAMILFREDWPRIASHEILEMLADPSGDRVVAGDSPDPDQGRVEFLMEVCDPCSDSTYAVNGIALSDFCTQHYYEPIAAPGVRYSFTGSLPGPYAVLPGGYLSWRLPGTNQWFRAIRSARGVRIDPAPGPVTGASLRESIDRHARAAAPSRKKRRPSRREAATLKRRHDSRIARAAQLREDIAALSRGT
jgi:hypothetical protein